MRARLSAVVMQVSRAGPGEGGSAGTDTGGGGGRWNPGHTTHRNVPKETRGLLEDRGSGLPFPAPLSSSLTQVSVLYISNLQARSSSSAVLPVNASCIRLPCIPAPCRLPSLHITQQRQPKLAEDTARFLSQSSLHSYQRT